MTEMLTPSIELLQAVRLLRCFNADELRTLLNMGKSVHYEAHANVMIEGELSWGIYLILQGAVKIFKANQMTGDSYEVGQLGNGNFFGEMSLIDQQPRSATVKVLLNSQFFYIDKADFQRFLDESNERKIRFYESCLKTIVNRLRETDSNYAISQYQLWKSALKKEAA
jgi:CRP/FNR family cyclic AMP-dependent transcriptional regulator